MISLLKLRFSFTIPNPCITNSKNLINQGIRKGSWNLLSDGSVKILYKYKGKIIVITGKVVDKIFRNGDAWVWNGKGKP